MGVKDGIIAGIASVAPIFAAANEPYTEQSVPSPQAIAPACTVRLNRYTDDAPIDERYINTEYADTLRKSGSLSGITYTQTRPLEDDLPKFRYMDKNPGTVDASFQSEVSLNGRYMPDGRYFETLSGTPSSSLGKIAPAQYMNWTESYEVDLTNTRDCMNIRHALISWAPDYRTPFSFMFSTLPTHTSNSFADNVWKNTGFPSDSDNLSKNPTVRVIDRETRLQQDRASGQLQSDYSTLPPPWKP